MTTAKARASRRWITLWGYLAIWAAVGFVFREWEIFAGMTIPLVSLGGGYILGESWRPSNPTGIPQSKQPETET